MRREKSLMSKPWRLPCSVCGEVSAETYNSGLKRGLNFCEEHWGKFRELMDSVDWQADPKSVVKEMRRRLDGRAQRWLSTKGRPKKLRLIEETKEGLRVS